MSVLEFLVGQAARLAPELAVQRALAEFEPTIEKVRIRPARVGWVTKALRATPHDGFALLPKSVGRENFLYAAWKHLVELDDHEELVVGLGRRHGPRSTSPSRIEGLWRGVGGRGSVSFTPLALQAIQNQAKVERGDILVVHNHPPHLLKSFLSGLFGGWKPMPSSGDRNTAFAHDLRALGALMKGQGNAGFRWYLVDEGRLAQFFMPSTERLVALLGLTIKKG